MALLDFLSRVLNRDEGSKETAKQRLQLVLVQDRASVNPHLLEELKEDLIGVISRYLEIDLSAMEINLESGGGDTVALVANIPVRQVRRSQQK
ncbi:MAG: cell division topological specificity factor MinE [Firmicutes bacterium]|nr:cell division topological specificity factor MinE [Bacillota bacterium]HQD40868.1 cell division topological specificity factor MinE [Bacillota bacterium]